MSISLNSESIISKSMPNCTKRYHGWVHKLNVLCRYTHQFRAVENLVSTQDHDFSKDLPQEYQPYLQYVNRNSLDEHPSALRTRSRDEEIYKTAVEVPQRLAEQQVTQEWTFNTKNAYEGYAAYTKSDPYWRSTTQQKQHDLLSMLHSNALGASLSAATAAAAVVAGSIHKDEWINYLLLSFGSPLLNTVVNLSAWQVSCATCPPPPNDLWATSTVRNKCQSENVTSFRILIVAMLPGIRTSSRRCTNR